MGDRAPDHGAVPERAGRGPRPVQDRAPAGDRPAGAVQGRRAAGAVRQVANIPAKWMPVRRQGYAPINEPPMRITAAVARERFGSFAIETLDLADPRPHEQLDQHGRDGYYDTPL